MKKWISRCYLALCLPCALNFVLLWAWMSRTKWSAGRPSAEGILHICIIAVVLLTYWKLLLFPKKRERAADPGLRVRIMMSGQRAVYWGSYAMAAQAFIFWRVYFCRMGTENISMGVLIANAVLAATGAFALVAAGVLKIFFTSRRLSIPLRVVMVAVMWIFPLNTLALFYACRLIYEEYDYECARARLRGLRVDSGICKTRYPLVMVHGIGFRDLKYFNYWGRIPEELMRNGALVYYGNQEALGTIAYNGGDIKKKILQVLKETGSGKVNIIAHSKGGLDARYAISELGMAPYVASLTTMSTPHRGCRFVDYACRLPDGLYRLVAACFDWTFRRFGDKNPDFYTATRQFSTEATRNFNERTPDSPLVYYQSYASKMKYPWSHMLLAVPYCMVKPLEGENDGLVSVDSARWGEFKGVFSNKRTRGISHGDMVDLTRQDYRDFDVIETYVQIVAELREKGF